MRPARARGFPFDLRSQSKPCAHRHSGEARGAARSRPRKRLGTRHLKYQLNSIRPVFCYAFFSSSAFFWTFSTARMMSSMSDFVPRRMPCELIQTEVWNVLIRFGQWFFCL